MSAQSAASGGAPDPLLGIGQVRHTRLRPARNHFVYPIFFLLMPMRGLRAAPSKALPRNRFALISFQDADHGDGRNDSLAWLEEVLTRECIHDARGEVWLHCFPRVLGFAFKPVSFWYCHRTDGSLAAVVVEVNNTFGERHCYLLSGPDVAFGRELTATKVFHVSPFCAVGGSYRFRFMRCGLHPADSPARTSTSTGPTLQAPPCASAQSRAGPGRTVVRIDHHDEHGPLVLTSVSGQLQPLTAALLRRTFFNTPFMTFGIVVRICWQAFRLWRKDVPFFSKPAPPATFVTRRTDPPQ